VKDVEIILVRHGPPARLDRSPITGREISAWTKQYDEAGIDRSCRPPEFVSRLVAAARWVVASNLRRSVESASLLVSPSDVHIDPELREAVLPPSIGVSIRMSPGIWVAVARVAWWLDWCPSDETLRATRQRAVRSADRLCSLARTRGSVAVVGHGMFNRMIARQLARRGWRGPIVVPRAYWGAARFTREAGVGQPGALG
jgi:broad specificity phosphatase PhoE